MQYHRSANHRAADKCLQKRPLLHPPIHAPSHTSQERIIYISASTPFISAVKRVETLLGFNPKAHGKTIEGAGEVTLKATGKAISHALEIGCYFMKGGERVVVKTGTVEVVDDVVEKVDWEGVGEGGAEGGQMKRKGGGKRKKGKGKKREGSGDVETEDCVEEVFMKARKISMVEIIISSSTVD